MTGQDRALTGFSGICDIVFLIGRLATGCLPGDLLLQVGEHTPECGFRGREARAPLPIEAVAAGGADADGVRHTVEGTITRVPGN